MIANVPLRAKIATVHSDSMLLVSVPGKIIRGRNRSADCGGGRRAAEAQSSAYLKNNRVCLISAVRIGRKWYVDQAYLWEFLDQHMVL